MVEEHEELISYVAAGNRVAFLEVVKERQGDENSNDTTHAWVDGTI